MKIAVVINLLRLTPALKTLLESGELSKNHDMEYDLFTPTPNELENTLNNLNYQTYNACLIGGGDGTVRTAAQILCQQKLPMAILPLGTFNILANSMQYPNDINAIFGMIKNKKTKDIDLASVNDNIFVNHAWLGVYYHLLQQRKQHRNIVGTSRVLKALFNTIFIFTQIPVYEFKIKTDETVITWKTCLILFSNNETLIDIFSFDERPLLATGLLYVNILNCHTRWKLFKCMLAFIFKLPNRSKFVGQFAVDELTVSSTRKEAKMVLDGELMKLQFPLHIINHKNKLTMITP